MIATRRTNPTRGTVDTTGNPTQRPSVRPQTTTYQAGETICATDDGVAWISIVRTGWVRLTLTLPSLRAIDLGVIGPNMLFVQEDATTSGSVGLTAKALSDVTVTSVELGDLAARIADSPDLAAALVAGTVRRFADLHALIASLLARDMMSRLATTLLRLAQAVGQPEAGGVVHLAEPLTRQVLAEMVGTTAGTLAQRLQEMERSGAVRWVGPERIAVDRAKLTDLAQRRLR